MASRSRSSVWYIVVALGGCLVSTKRLDPASHVARAMLHSRQAGSLMLAKSGRAAPLKFEAVASSMAGMAKYRASAWAGLAGPWPACLGRLPLLRRASAEE